MNKFKTTGIIIGTIATTLIVKHLLDNNNDPEGAEKIEQKITNSRNNYNTIFDKKYPSNQWSNDTNITNRYITEDGEDQF